MSGPQGVGRQASLAATAKMTAAARALETERPDRLFADPLAAALAGEEGQRLMREWRVPGAPPENPTAAARTRFCDELLLAALARGVRQFVLLGAGMDTRAFRLSLPPQTTVFELDEPSLLSEKHALLRRRRVRPSCRRVTLPADLTGELWPRALLAAGFAPLAPAFFTLESVSWCLAEAEVGALLDALARLAAPGSELCLDVLSRDYLDSPALLALLPVATSLGVYWQFGTNDPVDFLAEHGWRADAHRSDEVARAYGRWPPPGVETGAVEGPAKAAADYLLVAEPLVSDSSDAGGSVIRHRRGRTR
ncbi:MAG: SAM-dependent methyltransferase [Solirubrobacteraceae bacterium]